MTKHQLDSFAHGFRRKISTSISDVLAVSAHNHGAQSCGATGGDVAWCVADSPRTLEFELHILRGLHNHPRLWFAPWMVARVLGDGAFRMKGAVVKTFDRCAQTGRGVEQIGESTVIGIDVGFSETSTGHAALIGGNDETKSRITQSSQ